MMNHYELIVDEYGSGLDYLNLLGLYASRLMNILFCVNYIKVA